MEIIKAPPTRIRVFLKPHSFNIRIGPEPINPLFHPRPVRVKKKKNAVSSISGFVWERLKTLNEDNVQHFSNHTFTVQNVASDYFHHFNTNLKNSLFDKYF